MSFSAIIRADGGPGIGAGHLMRQLGIASEIVARRGSALLATTTPDEGIVDRWRAIGLKVVTLSSGRKLNSDAEALGELIQSQFADWVVLDGYHLGKLNRSSLGCAARIMRFDDTGSPDHDADLIVNPNAGAEHRYAYSAPSLLGCQYAVLRPEIRLAESVASSGATRIVMTFGGDDSKNFALQGITRLKTLKRLFECTVVCTAGPEGLAEALAVAGRDLRFKVIGKSEIAELMARADIGICAGGGTALEFASLGVPSVIVALALNQEPGAVALAQSGCAILAGFGHEGIQHLPEIVDRLLEAPERRERMSALGPKLVDGRGVERICNAMERVLACGIPKVNT